MSKEATAGKKKSKAKRIILGIVLSVLAVIIVVVAVTYAVTATKESGFTFTKVDGGYEVRYEVSMKDSGDPDLRVDLEIPAEYNGQPVVGIAKYGFPAGQMVRAVKIPASVTYIGEAAFKSCLSLSAVVIEGSGLKTVGKEAFFECKELDQLDLPDSVESIGGYAFYWCIKLKSFDIPTAVTKIESSTFSNCSTLGRVTGTGITSIGEYTFWNCSKLADISGLELTKGATVADNAFEGCTLANQHGNLQTWLEQWK